jgi:hypothetical protein
MCASEWAHAMRPSGSMVVHPHLKIEMWGTRLGYLGFRG